MAIKRIILMLLGLLFVPPCLFFFYYTARLLYLNLTMPDAAAHWSGGMLIGAIAFPVASLVFGISSWFCFRAARRSKRNL